DADEANDEFALSLDDENTEDDELSKFSFDSDDDESAVASDSSEALDSADSFFGLDEESEGGVEVAEVADASDSDDEFALSLDDEDTGDDEFALSLDDEGTGDDEFALSLDDEETEEDEFALLLDDEESEEFVLTLDDEETQGLGFEASEEDAVDLNLDAELLETDEQESEIALGHIAEIATVAAVAATVIKATSGDDRELLLDQTFEQARDTEGQRENELLLAEDVVEADSEKVLAEDADTADVAPLFDVAPFVAAATAVSSAPFLENVRSVNALARAAKRSERTPQQIMILDLIESATALIGQKDELDTDDQVVVQELAAGLELAAEDPLELTALVHHYTIWQQDFFRRVMASKEEQHPQPVTSAAPVISDSISNQDAVHQVQEGFSQLREAMMEEFNQLRKELQKG
ncbi:MAG: hypothetical protein D3903_16705, partial [Candidatus Electrothrix sp. GM3_4]|nr:hypothetical protein [Candidatus Electrothrix sp. GM3_4]